MLVTSKPDIRLRPALLHASISFAMLRTDRRVLHELTSERRVFPFSKDLFSFFIT